MNVFRVGLVLIALGAGVVLNTVGVVTSFVLNGDRVDQINQERAQNIERNCQDVNARHDAAVRELDRLLKRSGAPDRSQARANTKALIDALAPVRDCARLARSQVKPNP